MTLYPAEKNTFDAVVNPSDLVTVSVTILVPSDLETVVVTVLVPSALVSVATAVVAPSVLVTVSVAMVSSLEWFIRWPMSHVSTVWLESAG